MNKVLLWDFDGTLVYPNKSFNTALHTALCEYGYKVDAESVKELMLASYSWHNPDDIYPDKKESLWWDTLYKKLESFYKENNVDVADYNKINQTFKNILTSPCNYSLYDDAVAVLEECTRRGYTNYVMSSNYPELPQVIEALGIAKYFKDFFVSSLIGYDKPHREIFEHALKVTGNPEICYMIGDNPIADMKGAKACGIRTVFVHKSGCQDADFEFATLTEVLDIL
jgi:putative hydrolase of the HAD superfamily